MSNHSVIEHRANYHHIRIEEDYVSICRDGDASPHCKALILSILEHWTNTKRDKGEEPIIYMTYQLWAENMYCLFGRNTIIQSLKELETDGLIKRLPHVTPKNKDTFAYTLVVSALQKKLKELPDKAPEDTRPNPNAFKNKRVLKQTRLKKDEPRVPNQTADAFKKGHNVSSITKLQDITSESIGNEVSAVEPIAPIVALSLEQNTSHIATTTTENAENVESLATRNVQSIEQQSLLPVEKPKVSSKQKEKHTEPLAPKKVPEMPSDDMAWGTNKCKLMFDAWRGHTLIGYYKLTQASTCAKGLAEQYTEDEVRRVYQIMSEDAYWQEKGLDICNVANNIHKEIKKVKSQKKSTSRLPETETRPSFLVSEEQKQKNLDKLRKLAAAKAAKE